MELMCVSYLYEVPTRNIIHLGMQYILLKLSTVSMLAISLGCNVLSKMAIIVFLTIVLFSVNSVKFFDGS